MAICGVTQGDPPRVDHHLQHSCGLNNVNIFILGSQQGKHGKQPWVLVKGDMNHFIQKIGYLIQEYKQE